MEQKADFKPPAKKTNRRTIFLITCAVVVAILATLNATVDLLLHEDIGFFDVEHIIVGGITALVTSLLLVAVFIYTTRLEKSVRKLSEAEREASESEQKYREIFEQSRDVIFTASADGTFTELNPAAVKLFGYASRDEMLQLSLDDLYANQDDATRDRRDLESEGSISDRVVNMKRNDGSEITVSMSAETVSSDDDRMVARSGMMRDITSQRRMELQLLQAKKIESVGRLAGGVAHDFNNYLTTIQGYTDLALMELPEDSAIYANLMQVRQASEKAADLTSQLLLFSRHQPMDMHQVNLNESVAGLKHMIERLVDKESTIVTNLSDNLKFVLGDPGSLGQVIVNLALNAASAMPGGEVTITTCNGSVNEDYIEQHPVARPGEFATVSVSDSGPGLTGEVLEHVFEPFYKSAQGGSDNRLGLSVVYGIVLQHDGWIDVDSIPGMGTTFTVFLPAMKSAPEGDGGFEPERAEDLLSHGEHILVVEDDDAVLGITERILRENGYVVTCAHDAAEAFARFASEKGDFQLVFSDIVLPGENGLKLAENLKSHKPDLQVLLASGYADTAVDWQTVQARGYRFMQKPYAMPELLKTIRELLSHTS